MNTPIISKPDTTEAPIPPPPLGKRVNFILSEKAHSDLTALSRDTKRSMTELIRLGLGLVKIALEAENKGQKLVVATADGDQVKEIVLP